MVYPRVNPIDIVHNQFGSANNRYCALPPIHQLFICSAKADRCQPEKGDECGATWDVPALDRAAVGAPLSRESFKTLLFFSGKMNFNWGRHYSLGVRQVDNLAFTILP